jgi:transposase
VLSVEKIQDPEKLRRIAGLLDREVDRLQQQVRDLVFENARLRGETLAQIDFSFPPRALQKALTEEKEEPPSTRPARPPQPGHGPRPQKQLPVVEQVHELPPAERGCGVCGGELAPMPGQYEESEEVTVTERSYRLVVHRRQKYRCRCNSNVQTAPGPVKLIPGGRYSLDFAVHVAVQKYGDHLPLERQVEIMARQGLETSSQALWDQIEAAAQVLRPSYEALGQWLLAQPLLHADETGWPVNAQDTQKPRWTAWCLCNERAIWFRIANSKSEAEGRKLLGDYRGTVVADGYKVYKNLAQSVGRSGYRLAHCWAHVLRKFRDTEQTDPRSGWMLERIAELYAIEREILVESSGDSTHHLALRQTRARPLLQQIQEWALAQGGLRRSDFGKAVAYVLSHWLGLTRFLEDAAVPLDNNPAERALRGLVTGRKNHYGSRSPRGAETSEIFYSLLGTAKLCGVDPVPYLRQALTAALRSPGEPTITLPFALS